MNRETAFEMAVSSIRFGVGVTREVGMDLREMGVDRVMVLTDPTVGRLPPVQTVLESLEQSGISFSLYDRVRVEPTEESFLDAIAFARERPCSRVRRGRRRLDHRHRQGGQSLHDLSAGRLPGLRESAYRQRVAGARVR